LNPPSPLARWGLEPARLSAQSRGRRQILLSSQENVSASHVLAVAGEAILDSVRYEDNGPVCVLGLMDVGIVSYVQLGLPGSPQFAPVFSYWAQRLRQDDGVEYKDVAKTFRKDLGMSVCYSRVEDLGGDATDDTSKLTVSHFSGVIAIWVLASAVAIAIKAVGHRVERQRAVKAAAAVVQKQAGLNQVPVSRIHTEMASGAAATQTAGQGSDAATHLDGSLTVSALAAELSAVRETMVAQSQSVDRVLSRLGMQPTERDRTNQSPAEDYPPFVQGRAPQGSSTLQHRHAHLLRQESSALFGDPLGI